MAKRSLLLLGCALLGVLLWVLASGGNSAPPPADAVDAGAQAETTGGLLTGSGAGAVGEPADVLREGAEPQRSVVDTGEAATADFELVKVDVVRKESGEPVAGATVWYYGIIDRTGWSE